jgi:RNA recognition motif-containing protein
MLRLPHPHHFMELFSVSGACLTCVWMEFVQIHQPPSRPGLAYILYTDARRAFEAYQALDGTTFQGRLLHILPAINRNPKPESADKQSFKKQRSEKKKGEAGREWNWSALYMNVCLPVLGHRRFTGKAG